MVSHSSKVVQELGHPQYQDSTHLERKSGLRYGLSWIQSKDPQRQQCTGADQTLHGNTPRHGELEGVPFSKLGKPLPTESILLVKAGNHGLATQQQTQKHICLAIAERKKVWRLHTGETGSWDPPGGSPPFSGFLGPTPPKSCRTS